MADDRSYVLDNRVEFSESLRLIFDQENETVSSTRSNSQVSLNSSSTSSNVMDVVRSDSVPVKTLHPGSHGNLENGPPIRRFNSVDVENGGSRRNNSVDVYKHCHQQFLPPQDKVAQRQLMVAATMCLIFLIGEFIGGYFAHSLAIMTDAAHMLSDFASFLISLFSVWLARRPATRKLSFGYYRAEVLGAVVSIIIIWVLTGILIYLAIERIITQEYNVNSNIMLIISGVGVLFNVAMGFALTTDKCHIKHSHGGGGGHSHGGGGGHSHGGGRGHSHGNGGGHSHENGGYGQSSDGNNHNHGGMNSLVHVEENRVEPVPSVDCLVDNEEDFSPRNRRLSLSVYSPEERSGVNKSKNINVRAAFIHVLGDFIQSIGVFIAALIIKFEPTWQIADPICTFLFSILVLFTTVTVLRDAVHVLMEGTPRDVAYDQVLIDLQTIDGVKAAHSLHVWSLTLDKAALAVHLAIMPGYDALIIMQKASRMMRFKYSLSFTTIQVEPWDEPIMSNCFHCAGPQS